MIMTKFDAVLVNQRQLEIFSSSNNCRLLAIRFRFGKSVPKKAMCGGPFKQFLWETPSRSSSVFIKTNKNYIIINVH